MTTQGREQSSELDAVLASERAIMNAYAAHYRQWTLTGSLVYMREREAFGNWLVSMLQAAGKDPSVVRCLDVGCGTGEILEQLARHGVTRLTGLDCSAPMVEQARKHLPQAEYVTEALQYSRFAPGSFDVITAAFTVHHLYDPDAFFAAAREWLAPQGILFILDYNRDAWSYAPGWRRLALRVLVAPLRFLVRWKNRDRIAAQPPLRSQFNPAHRILAIDELRAKAHANGFECESVLRGLLRPWFLQDVFPGQVFDDEMLSLFGAVEDRLCPPHGRLYHWLAARRTD